MATRTTYYAESLAESTTQLITDVLKVSLDFTPETDARYVILASWMLRSDNEAYYAWARTYVAGDIVGLHEYRPKDGTDYITGGFQKIVDYGNSPGEINISVYFTISNVLGNAYIKNAKIFVLKLDAADKYAEDDTGYDTYETDYQDQTTLTFTPATQGEYSI
jgi:hypothetical protein